MHIAIIGTGRVGRPTAYSIMCEGLANTISVCDAKPNLAFAFSEDLKHAAAGLGIDVEVAAFENCEDITGADIILISAGEAYRPGSKSRRDLAVQNAKIIKYIAEAISSRNPGARYIVITNPTDVMAMVCKKFSKANFVISTGTNVDSMRFRQKLASVLKAPVSQIRGWVGGEHGEAAVLLWSTAKVKELPVEHYAKSKNIILHKEEIESYVKTGSKFVVETIGGTEYGPSVSHRNIVRAIVKNTMEIMSVAIYTRLKGLPEPVFVGIPVKLGRSIGTSLYDILSEEEKTGIEKAARIIYETYKSVIESIE